MSIAERAGRELTEAQVHALRTLAAASQGLEQVSFQQSQKYAGWFMLKRGAGISVATLKNLAVHRLVDYQQGQLGADYWRLTALGREKAAQS